MATINNFDPFDFLQPRNINMPRNMQAIRILQTLGRKYAPNFTLGEGSPLKFIGDASQVKNFLAPYVQGINFKLGEGSPLKFANQAKAVTKNLPVVKNVAPEVDDLFKNAGNKFASELGNINKATGTINRGAGVLGGMLATGAIASADQARRVAGYLKSLGEYGRVADPKKSPEQVVKDFNSLYFGKRQGAADAPLRTIMTKGGLYTPTKTATLTAPPQQYPWGNLPADNGVANPNAFPAVPGSAPIGGDPVYGYSQGDMQGNFPMVAPMNNNIADEYLNPQGGVASSSVSTTNGVNYVPGQGRLGDQLLGSVYVEPTQYQGVASPDRIQNYLSAYDMTPEEYRNAALRDASRAGWQAILNRNTSTNVAPYSELATNQNMAEYMKQGYSAEAAINQAERDLAGAYALSYQTGLPVSITSSPDKMLQYVYGPMIKGKEQRETLRQVLGNDIAVQKLKNEAERYKADTDKDIAVRKYYTDLQTAEMSKDARLYSATIQAIMLDPQVTAQDVYKLLSTNLPEDKAAELTALSQAIKVRPGSGEGKEGRVNAAAMSALIRNSIGNPYGQY